MSKTAVRAVKIFNMIKNLPELINVEKNNKVSQFYRGIANFGMKNLRISFKQFKDCYLQGDTLKRYIMRTAV